MLRRLRCQDDPLAAQEPILKLDSINYGYAAG